MAEVGGGSTLLNGSSSPADDVALSNDEFHKLVEAATTAGGGPLDLRGRRAVITEVVRCGKHRGTLDILGGEIVGSECCHSIFIATCKPEGRQRVALRLRGVILRHLAANEDRRQVGAAIFVMGHACVELDGCDVHTENGFPVWLKHDSCAALQSTALHGGRTGVACFNRAAVTLVDCAISHTSKHGICARGSARVSVSGGTVTRCSVRGVYAYQTAHCSLARGVRVSCCAIAVEVDDEAVLLLDPSCDLAEGCDLPFKDSRPLVRANPPDGGPNDCAATVAR